MTDARTETVRGLRELADWLEATPEAPVLSYGNVGGTKFDVYLSNAHADTVRSLARTEGVFQKQYAGSFFNLKRLFSGDVVYELNIQRDAVCERVQVGETVVPERPAVAEHVEPVYEWQCEPLLRTTA